MRPRRKGKRRDEPWVLYSRGEDIFYMILHIISGAFSAGILTTCVVFTALHHTWEAVLATSIYGSAMLITHILLAIYHGLPYGIGKDVMYVLARDFIYIFFLGSVMILYFIRGDIELYHIRMTVFFLSIVCAVFGIVFSSISLEKFKVISFVCYGLILWLIMVPAIAGEVHLGVVGFIMLFLGNVAYTICGICRYQGDESTFFRVTKKITFYIGMMIYFVYIMFFTIL